MSSKWNLFLLIPGILTFVIGVGHIFLPTYGYPASVPAAMAEPLRDHFYYLATYAICGFLLTLGVLTIYFSRQPIGRTPVVFAALLTLLWIARLILEWRYPVTVPIFWLENPTQVLLPVLTVITACFAFYTWSGIRQLQLQE